MTVQEVVEAELPEVGQVAYQVYQFPSRALLNPERDVTVLKNQEISIEPMQTSLSGKKIYCALCIPNRRCTPLLHIQLLVQHGCEVNADGYIVLYMLGGCTLNTCVCGTFVLEESVKLLKDIKMFLSQDYIITQPIPH